LDVVAALNDSGDTLTLFCVNRHLTRDIRAHVAIEGFVPAPLVSVQILVAENIYEKNDAANPEAIHPQQSSVKMAQGKLIFPFRHESVTVLTLRKGK
jgi:alpha-N-arabinofuranosidase